MLLGNESQHGGLSCNGEKACYGSTIYENNEIRCYGDESCANTTVYFTGDSIFINGNSGIKNSIIYIQDTIQDTNSTATTTESHYLYFNGVYSGNGATVICDIDVTCNIECHNNACNNLTLACGNSSYYQLYSINDDTHNSCYFDIACESAEISDICSTTGYSYSVLPALTNAEKTIVSNSVTSCDDIINTDINLVNCQDFEECSSQPKVGSSISDTSRICCTASSGCKQSDNIIVNGDNFYYVNSSLPAIRCDGYESCFEINKYIDTSLMSGGNIYFSGYIAGYQANITQNSNKFDVYCNGGESCRAMKMIESVDNLYCTADQSCKEVELIRNVNNVWGYGYQALQQVKQLENVYENVYCGTSQACGNITIDNVLGNVIGMGESVLREATITNVNGTVYGVGQRSMLAADVANSTSVSIFFLCY